MPPTLSGILKDLRYSARSLVRNPGLASALLVTIAIGLGANVTVGAFIRGLTTSQAPVRLSGKVVSVFRSTAQDGPGPVSYDRYLSLRRRLEPFQWMGAARISQAAVTVAGKPAILSVAAVTPELAQELRLPLNAGVLLSYRAWQAEFGGRADLRGQPFRMGATEAPVAGLAPDGLEGLYGDRTIDAWTLLRPKLLQGHERTSHSLWVLAGLRPNVSPERAQAAIGRGDIEVLPYTGMAPEMADGLARAGRVLRIAAGFVFLVACANVASFLLGRAAGRLRETSLRVALGAARRHLAQAVLSDSTVICVGGGTLGVVLGIWTSRILPALLFDRDAGFLVLAPHTAAVAEAWAVGIGILILCGMLPLLETPYDRPAAVLRRESAGPSRMTRAVSAGVVIAQMACCCLLVIGTGLIYQGFRAALRGRTSPRLGHPILATVQADPDVGLRYFRDVESAVHSVAGVFPVAWAGSLPGGQPAWQSFRIEPREMPLRNVQLDVEPFTSDSLPRFTLPPKSGRLFNRADQGCRSAVVNQAAAAILFGGETVGRAVYDSGGRPVEIIGALAARGGASRRPTIYYDYTDLRRAFQRSAANRFRAAPATPLDTADLDAIVVSPEYFAIMGIPLVAGRLFTAAEGCRAGVVNQEAADVSFGGKAVGAAVVDELGRRTEIVGVVRSARLGAFQESAAPAIYFPMTQDFLPRMTLILGATAAGPPVLHALRRAIEPVPGSGPAPLVVKTLDTYLKQTSLAPLRISIVIMGASAGMALLLGLFGLYGVLNAAARERSREMALRIALGARRRHVIGRVLWDAGRLAGAGALSGVAASLVMWRWLPELAPGAGAPEWWVWLAGPLGLAAAVALASVLPARRSLMTDPLMILRDSE